MTKYGHAWTRNTARKIKLLGYTLFLPIWFSCFIIIMKMMGEIIPLETYRLKTITLETTFYLFLLQATMSESLGKISDTIESNDSLPFWLLMH